MQTIDYSALQSIGIKSGHKLKGKHKLFILLMWLGFFPAFIVSAFLLSLFPLLWLVVICGIFYAAKKYGISNKRMNQAFAQFAEDNDWRTGGTSPKIPMLTPMHYKSGRAILNGVIDGLPFWYYDALPMQKGGSNNAPLAMLTVEVPKKVPTILLAPASGIMGMAVDSIVINNFNLEPIQLEGNFSDSVRMYIPKNLHIDALTYITPEVMELVRDKVSTYVMFSGNYVSTCTEFGSKFIRLPELFDGIQIIAKEVKEKQNI